MSTIKEVLTYPMSQLKTSATEFLAEMPNARMSWLLDNMTVRRHAARRQDRADAQLEGAAALVWGTGVHDTGKHSRPTTIPSPTSRRRARSRLRARLTP